MICSPYLAPIGLQRGCEMNQEPVFFIIIIIIIIIFKTS